MVKIATDNTRLDINEPRSALVAGGGGGEMRADRREREEEEGGRRKIKRKF